MAPETTLPKAPESMPAVRKMMKRFDLVRLSMTFHISLGKPTARSFDTMSI
jgi:hypothetical protein